MSQTVTTFDTNDIVMREAYRGFPEILCGEGDIGPNQIEECILENKNKLIQLKTLMKELISQLIEERNVEVNLSNEAMTFCEDESLIKYLGLMEDLIKRHFPTVTKITFSMEQDPEIPDEWVSAEAEVSGEIDQVIEWENEFVKKWVAETPFPQRKKIRLLCDMV